MADIARFQDGLKALFGSTRNLAVARDNLEYAVEDYPNDCDTQRAMAYLDFLETREPASRERLEKIYENRAGWGQTLQKAFGRQDVPLPIKVAYGFLEWEYTNTTPSVVYLGYASKLTAEKRFELAHSVISGAPVRIPAVVLADALVYHGAARWQDVLELCQNIHDPNTYDQFDNELDVKDRETQSLAWLLTGIANAHLGNLEGAKSNLATADAPHPSPNPTPDDKGYRYPAISAEVLYHLGLIAREEDDEHNAQIYFNSALGQRSLPKVQQALDNPDVKLHLTTSELIKQRALYWDASTEPLLTEVKAVEFEAHRAQLLEEASEELEKQIGMENVKAEVRKLRGTILYEEEKIRRGLKVAVKTRNLIFTGPPGTGKTTIARVVAKTFAGLGLSRTDKVVEKGPGDFIGSSLGESKKKTREVIAEAKGGVLFLDEAYDIVQWHEGKPSIYGIEAVGELLLALENDRADLIVIIAGYAGPMQRFLSVNDGLRSRFSKTIAFKSYTPQEIGDIAALMASLNDLILPDESREILMSTASRLSLMKTMDEEKSFLDIVGNGRFCRNVIESAEEHHGNRLSIEFGNNINSPTLKEFQSLTPADILPAIAEQVDPITGTTTNLDHLVTAGGQIQ
ncbi:type VII secretion AAA-ATPase EccA [Mycobacteroides abscessus subsp. abscessus]|uniref:AAA family ATPase n=1 Tax=Mycobacteroides abscessus TaxID=36809 RepID=UPI00092AE8AA|nr:AAA family ATPase [Mycobacteroides abscessus]SIH21604.1 type VII secretion AAA-ATPase EccA [Mycobacteroides abscessus subsp. abscessus]